MRWPKETATGEKPQICDNTPTILITTVISVFPGLVATARHRCVEFEFATLLIVREIAEGLFWRDQFVRVGLLSDCRVPEARTGCSAKVSIRPDG